MFKLMLHIFNEQSQQNETIFIEYETMPSSKFTILASRDLVVMS